MTGAAGRTERCYDMGDLRQGLLDNISLLMSALGLVGAVSRAGGVTHFMPLNPTRHDRHAGSFIIDIAGPTKGRWKEFADASGQEKGDLIDLIGYVKFGTVGRGGRGEAIRWAGEWLGLEPERRAAAARRAVAGKPVPEVKASSVHDHTDTRTPAEKAAAAKGWWLNAAELPGTLGERYLLEARNIPLMSRDRYPGAVRFLARTKYNLSDAPGTMWPALISAMTNGRGQIVAVHRTFLAEDGGGKAPVAKAKQMWPEVHGTSIRLSRGYTGKRRGEAYRAGVRDESYAAFEGIEKALIFAAAFPEYRVDAAGSVSLFHSLPPCPTAAREILGGDNDHTFEKVREQAQKRAALLKKPVTAWKPPDPHDDVDDWYQALFREGGV